MKIAQVAPLHESVPPRSYGGTERVVSYLTEELVEQGHDVTLYASGDSRTRARLRAACKRSLRLDAECVDQLAHHILLIEQVLSEAPRFDIVHFHIDYLSYPFVRRLGVPSVTTLHGRLDIPDLVPLYEEFRDVPVVSISDAQREPLSWINWKATVHHGLPADLYSFRDAPGDYIAFLGRTSPEKGVDRAIEIARRAGRRLLIAAKLDDSEVDHFEKVLRPLLGQPGVEFMHEIGEDQKGDFLGNASALLFPIDWPEPFGLVMIEALACGTPVVAYRRGSVPEILEDGVTGFMVDGPDEAVDALKEAASLDRRRCRKVFEERFTAKRMTRDYLDLYGSMTGRGSERRVSKALR